MKRRLKVSVCSAILLLNTVSTGIPISAMAADVDTTETNVELVPEASDDEQIGVEEVVEENQPDGDQSSEDNVEPPTGEDIDVEKPTGEEEQPIEQNGEKEEELKPLDELQQELMNINTDFQIMENGDDTVTITGYSGVETDIIIPQMIDGKLVVEVADGAFKGKSLSTVTFEGDIRRIGREAFYGNSLSSVIFKGNVDLVEPKGFQENNVDMVWVVEGNLGILGDININYDNNAGIGADWNVDGRVFGKDDISPNTVDGDNYDRGNHISISIQGSVNTLASGSLSLINLTSLSINGNLNNMNERAISRSNVGNIHVQSDLGFVEKYSSYMANISNIEIIGGVNDFGDNAFAYAVLERITVNGDIQNLGYQSFHYVNYFNPSKFLEVHFKGNVLNVGNSVFYHGNISSLNIDGDIPFISKYMFNDLNFESKSTAALSFNGRVGYVEDYAFYYAGISSLHIASGLTKLGEFSLNMINVNNTEYANITVDGPIDTIGSWALYGAKIDNLTINGSINTIKEYAAVDSKINKLNVKGDLGIVELKSFNISKIGQLIVEGDFITAGNSSFLESEIGSILVGGNVGTLEEDSFRESKIGPITVNGNVGTFGYSAMFRSDIGDITILGDWDTIGENSLSEATIGNILIKSNLNLVESVSIRHSKVKDFIVDGDLNTVENSGFLETVAENFEVKGNFNKADDFAFQSAKLKSVLVYGEVGYIGKYSFQQTEIDNIEFKSKVKVIDNCAFLQGKFKTVIFRDDVEKFISYSFLTVTADKVEVYGNVSLLGESTFQDAVIPIIHFYGSVDVIDRCAFLQTISDKVTFVGDVLETKDSTFLEADLGDVLFEGKIGKLGYSTFLSVNIRNSLVVMGDVGYIEEQAFLTVDIPYTHFYGNVGEIGNLAFVNNRGKNGIGSNIVIIEGRVGKTGDSSFQHLRTDKFVVKKGIGIIGPRSFMVSDIKELEIFNNTTQVGDMAFYLAKLSKDPNVPNTVSDMGEAIFLQAEAPSYTVNSTYKTMRKHFFTEAKGLKEFNMVDSVIDVEDLAFKDTGIEKVKLSTNLESLGEESFMNHKLSCITTNSKLTSIGKDSFKSTHVPNKDFIIWGDKGSESETYALANNHQFKENDVFSNDCNPAEWAIEVEYVDEQGTLLDSKTINKPAKGIHTEHAKVITGYTVNSDKTVSVEVTKENPNHTISFVYSKNTSPKPPETVQGIVTVKYVDEEDKVLDTKVVSNVPLGTHTEQAKQIAGYTVKDDQTITIEITNKNREHTITFVYSKNTSPKPPETVQGTVTVKYVDENETVLDSKVVNNLPLGEHIEHSKTFSGYEVNGPKQQSVEITQNNTIFTITFTYKKVNTPQPESPGPNQPEPVTPVTPPLVTTPSTTDTKEPLQENPREDVENQKGKRVIRDEGNGIFTTVPHYLDNNLKLKITTKFDYGILVTDRVSVPFKDIKGLYSYQEVEDLYNYLIVNGTTASSFSPNKDLKRGEFSAMIARALELRPKNKHERFKDVAVYKNEVQALYEANIITGYTDGTFGEGKTLTRQEAAAMIVRMLDYMGVETNVKSQVDLADMEQISEYAKAAVQYLATQDVLVSGQTTKFNPKRNLTRAEMAKVLMRALRLSEWYGSTQ